MKRPDWKQLTARRTLGLAVMALGVIVLFSPVVIGEGVIAVLGILLIAAGLFQIVETVRTAEQIASYLSYTAGVVTILLGLVLFLSPSLVLSGLLVAVTLFFLADGALKIFGAFGQNARERWWELANGSLNAALGLLIWFFLSARLGIAAIGVILGLRLLVEGWTMFFLPAKGFEPPDLTPDSRHHPDERLGIEPSDAVGEMRDALSRGGPVAVSQNVLPSLTILGIFFVIHVLRTDTQWSLIGFVSPFAAIIGDAAVALLVAIVLILPLRLLWRKISRPLERAAWQRLARRRAEVSFGPTFGEKMLGLWLAQRMKFALEMREMRYSLNFAFWRVLRLGLPLTAVLIAVNSIWGFSWYFNSENWASAVWQEVSKERVDVWRQRMTEDVERAALAANIPPAKIFAVEPEGVSDEGDFGFVIIGDTGEGDASQMSLRDQLIAVGEREEIKFLVLSSDVIYPDGKMKDYETKFYLPFKGFRKPIYAIPGNHDWFDANEGFNANFLARDAALLALRARLAEDLKTDVINTDQRFAEMTDAAGRLREYYRVKNGLQRAPFFEMHTARFSLIAADTGILRRLDAKQKAWLEAALKRAANNFKLVVLGHPFYVAGAYQGDGDAAAFREIHELLRRHKVDVTIAGDTHDFEFYREVYEAEDGEAEMRHFVNGGGGAYLSVGTALAFPEKPALPDYAFYPRTDQLTAKIKNEAPFWKLPFLVWMDWFDGYPFTDEAVSGAFDFNRAPFFQSFLEVRIERSQNRVRFLLHGVNGPLRWRDVQLGGEVKPAAHRDDDFVEFIAPLR